MEHIGSKDDRGCIYKSFLLNKDCDKHMGGRYTIRLKLDHVFANLSLKVLLSTW